MGLQDKGSANSQWWLESIGTAIGKGKEFERLASRQLAGLLIGVWWVSAFLSGIFFYDILGQANKVQGQ